MIHQPLQPFSLLTTQSDDALAKGRFAEPGGGRACRHRPGDGPQCRLVYYDSTRFKMPAVRGAVWCDFTGKRQYIVFVNISDPLFTA